MSKTIQEAIAELDKMVEVYEESYDKWDEQYYQNGIEGAEDILKDVTDPYDVRSDWEVAEDPAGEVYLNVVAYIEDGKPKLWVWLRDTH